MGRLLAIDYGLKRTGIAVSDILHLMAHPLITIDTQHLIDFLKDYIQKEPVEKFIIGYPKNLNNTPTHNTQNVEQMSELLKKHFPHIPQVFIDERFTSTIAAQTRHFTAYTKKEKRDKAKLDTISATIILQDFMNKSAIK